MGLDGVEIVMQWEKSLGVTIGNDEAVTLLTPRLAIDLLAHKLNASNEAHGGCLTLRAFNRLRFAISTSANIHRSEIHPNAKLRDLIVRQNRSSIWRTIQGTSGIASLPSLSWGAGFWFAPKTVGDLARWVVTHAAGDLKLSDEQWTRAEIRTVVRAVVTEFSGIRDFTDDDQFIRDIGID